MVPQRRIERRLKPYHGLVIPLYYCGIFKLYNISYIISIFYGNFFFHLNEILNAPMKIVMVYLVFQLSNL